MKQEQILKIIEADNKFSPLKLIPIQVLTAFAKALQGDGEPVARVIHQFETPEGTREILCVRLVDRLDVHTKLFTYPPDQTDKIKELEEDIKELKMQTNIRCGQVQERDAKLVNLQKQNDIMRKALQVVHDQLVKDKDFTQEMHLEPSWRYWVDEALATIKG